MCNIAYVLLCSVLLRGYTFPSTTCTLLYEYAYFMSTRMIRSQVIYTPIYICLCIGRSRSVLDQSECIAGDDGGVCVLRVLDYRLVWVYMHYV